MAERWVLQFCHCHYGPFLDVARQGASLFSSSTYKVLTVYLTGEDTPEVRAGSASDDVVFLGYSAKDVRGLKFGAIRALKRLVAERNVALVIAHRFKPVFVACLASHVPVIGVHHGFGDYARLSRRVFASVFRKRLMLLGVSNAVRDEIRDALPSWPEVRIQTLYNHVDVEALRSALLPKADARRHLGLPSDAFVVGNVGRLHADKDQATLIRGFAQAIPQLPKNARLAIMGQGKLEASLKQLAGSLGIAEKVAFLGQVAEGRRYFRAFDVFALTSDREPFGMVLLEAMAADVPTICSDCGGGREVVDGIGELFPFRDTSALANCLVAAAGRRGVPEPSVETALRARFSDDAACRAFWARMAEAGSPFSALRPC